MKVQMDINTYKASFTGAARQYNFFVVMQFPSWGNVLQSASQGLLANGVDQITSNESLRVAGVAAGNTAIDVLGSTGALKNSQFYVRSTYLPDSTFEEILTSWMGHDYKMSGKQVFTDWMVTYNVDKEGELLRKFFDWHKTMHDPESNNYGFPTSYMTNPEVHLLSPNTGETVCVYKMYGAWPKNIGQVQLDYANNDLATVDITFSYQYHTVTEREPGVLTGLAKRGARSYFQTTPL